ncbi:MAG: aminotransferase class V-fold PLP-dependent enzyme [Proteobacteria bacterium]|nr:aminotransferase class V-fold PLP-dependent enzyme [Pseudomonadota bacterium]
MSSLLTDVDPDGLAEFSVVFTDRSLNHMSGSFQDVMKDISRILKVVYHSDAAVVVPGGGTYAMEAVARQFATRQKCLVIRNGWFSFRWSQIFDMGSIPSECIVMKARTASQEPQSPFSPAPIDEVVATIAKQQTAVVFAPHVETASGMMLPNDYIRAVGQAVREYGGLFVLDCIASGCIWVDMQDCNVDVLISAPQKGWSGSPGAGLVMLNDRALTRLAETTSTSFACDPGKWHQIMQAYEGGGHAYHATMPTDSLRKLRDTMLETENYGFAKVHEEQQALGDLVRALLETRGFKSVAAAGFQAPGVVVSYTDDPQIQNGKKFLAQGFQIAAGVPLQCDEPADYMSFRIGLFGLDKLHDVDGTVARLASALKALA